jgi:hypothetical protein
MTFARIRAPGAWVDNSTVEDAEFEQFDDNVSNAVDGDGGGAYAPTARLEFGGAGVYVETLIAPGLSDIPMRGAFPTQDTGITKTYLQGVLVGAWCAFPHYPQWVFLENDVAIHTSDEVTFETTVPDITPNVLWRDCAASHATVVAVYDDGANYADEASTLSWAACSGALAVGTGDWRAIVWDGSSFLTGSAAGGFAYSLNGQVFTAAAGPTNWVAGPNTPAQIAAGKGPGGSADRSIAVADSGNAQYFAYTDDNGLSWQEIDVGVAKTWNGIAYRASDHTWIANAQDGTVYASTDGGVNWSLTVDLGSSGWVLSSKLWVVNEHFVTRGGGFGFRVIYSHDAANWFQGTDMSQGGGYLPSGIIPGNAGIAWAREDLNETFQVRFSQKSSIERMAI